MRFEHLRNIRQHHRHRVALADATAGQGRGQATAARIGLRPVTANRTVHHGRVVRVNTGGAFDKAQRREGNVVDGGRRKALFINRHASTHGRLDARAIVQVVLRIGPVLFWVYLYIHIFIYGS